MGVKMTAKNKLSKRFCDSIKVAKLYGDGGGLYLKVTPAITKSWVYRWGAGGSNVMGLGPFPTVSLAEARGKADDCRKLVAAGKNPLHARVTTSPKESSFKACAEKFIAQQAPSWSSARHHQQWENTLATYTYPVIGKMDVADIQTKHILEILQPIWFKKTVTASHVQHRMSKVLNWAKTMGHYSGQNPAQWQGHLENLLKAASKVKIVRHRPALPYQDVAEFMAKLRDRKSISSLLFEFQILTATRPSQPRLAQWNEIQDQDWLIPRDRSKNRKSDHRIPLSRQALVILEQLKDLGDVFIFPGIKKRQPMGPSAVEALLKRMEYSSSLVVPHGFRSTFKDWAGEVGEYDNVLSELALGHTITNKGEAAYRRGIMLERRRIMMQAWADFCDHISSYT